MERIKDLSKVILRGDGILVEIEEKKRNSDIILPDDVETESIAEKITILAVGNKIEDLQPGDIIFEIIGGVNSFKVNEQRIGLIYRNAVALAVSPDNYDEKLKKVNKVKLIG